jgi:hypothetical protein
VAVFLIAYCGMPASLEVSEMGDAILELKIRYSCPRFGARTFKINHSWCEIHHS